MNKTLYKHKAEAIRTIESQLKAIASKHNRSILEHFVYLEHASYWSDEDSKFHGLFNLLGALKSN